MKRFRDEKVLSTVCITITASVLTSFRMKQIGITISHDVVAYLLYRMGTGERDCFL